MYPEAKIRRAAVMLARGGVIAHATETCYGFACDAFSRRALKRLYRLKWMKQDKPVSILVADFKQAQRYGVFSKMARLLAQRCWPGPLTLIVKRKKTLPGFLNPGTKTIGIRVPDHALALSLARHFGRPLTTTSANISGRPPCYSISGIKRQFRSAAHKPDFILDAGRIKKRPPSTIIDLSGKKPQLVRQGELKISSLR